ncbi:unnamed protein product [Periconia digitata]|uniref:SGNH hydrolase-type esterase domain-containing protein n=1 Tax=Periconia digitata TaxID=1303443 RepID=A0A9W4UL42_9PLEO|nr:unnamed protein product [Periconia digitata]
MSRLYLTSLLALAVDLRGAFSYPTNTSEVSLLARDDGEFIFAALGDSWASGVTYTPFNSYDGNKDNCKRYSYAWSTVVANHGSDWLPDGKKAKLEFVACSGAKTENVMEQMDKTTRPKITLMEIGGNDADFYPLADSCLFHSHRDKNYGKRYEEDDAEHPGGECRREIKEVRGRVETDGIKKSIKGVINQWRYHPANAGNEASLYLHGYPWFFGDSEECNDWDFTVFYNSDPAKNQKLVHDLRTDFNKMIDQMNRNIREAVEEYQDPKIKYIDINPAFDQRRFCEPGASWWSQLNYNNGVWIWNNPARWIITIKNGNKERKYGKLFESPPQDEVEKMLAHPNEPVMLDDGDTISRTYSDPDDENHSMTLEGSLKDFQNFRSGGGDGSVSRTLHPTQPGHEAMAKIIIERLKKDFKSGVTQQPWGSNNCPAGCKCSSSGAPPLCS